MPKIARFHSDHRRLSSSHAARRPRCPPSSGTRAAGCVALPARAHGARALAHARRRPPQRPAERDLPSRLEPRRDDAAASRAATSRVGVDVRALSAATSWIARAASSRLDLLHLEDQPVARSGGWILDLLGGAAPRRRRPAQAQRAAARARGRRGERDARQGAAAHDAAAVTPPAATRTRRRPAAATPGSRRAPTPEELDRVRLMARLEDSLSPPPAERVAAGRARVTAGARARASRLVGVWPLDRGARLDAQASATSTAGRRAPAAHPTRTWESGGGRRRLRASTGVTRSTRSSRRARADASNPTRRRRWRWARRWAAASFASVGRRDPAAPPSPTRRAFRGATATAARERASWGQLLAAA